MPKILMMHSIKASDIVKRIKKGEIFVYPTDTVYGIGCSALNKEAVSRLMEIKKGKQFLSIIAPSKQWIMKNFYVKKIYVDKLPGPFTYVLKPKPNAVDAELLFDGKIGVRMPDHPFVGILQKAKVPFMMVDVNLNSELPAVDIKRISPEITEKADVIIDDGVLDNKPSTIFDFTDSIPRILRRSAVAI